MYCPSPALMLLLLRVLLLLVYRRRAAVGVARGESRWWCSRGLGRRPIDDAMKSAAVVLGRRMQCVASASACLPVCVEVELQWAVLESSVVVGRLRGDDDLRNCLTKQTMHPKRRASIDSTISFLALPNLATQAGRSVSVSRVAEGLVVGYQQAAVDSAQRYQVRQQQQQQQQFWACLCLCPKAKCAPRQPIIAHHQSQFDRPTHTHPPTLATSAAKNHDRGPPEDRPGLRGAHASVRDGLRQGQGRRVGLSLRGGVLGGGQGESSHVKSRRGSVGCRKWGSNPIEIRIHTTDCCRCSIDIFLTPSHPFIHRATTTRRGKSTRRTAPSTRTPPPASTWGGSTVRDVRAGRFARTVFFFLLSVASLFLHLEARETVTHMWK